MKASEVEATFHSVSESFVQSVQQLEGAMAGPNEKMNRNYISELNQFLERLLCQDLKEVEQFKNFAVQLTDKLPYFAVNIPVFDEEKEAFVLWHVDTKKNSISTDYIPINGNHDEPTLDLTGAPLQCSFMDSPDKEVKCEFPQPRKPTSVMNARAIISSYCQIVSKMDSEPHAMWVLCDGCDSSHTFALGAKKCNGKLCRRVVTYSWIPFVKQLPTMDSIKAMHLRGISNAKIKKNALAVYSIVSPGDYCDISSCANYSEVICTWSDVNNLLEDPGNDATYVMRFFVSLEDPRSKLYNRYKEMCLLERFADGLETREVAWLKNDEDISAVDRLSKFLDDIGTGQLSRERVNSAKNPDAVDVVDLEMILDGLSIGNEKDADSVDMIWSTLKGCSSYQELVECLTLLLKAVRNGTVRLSLRNRASEFAQLIRKMQYNREEEIPSFDDLLPLRLLVEIGIEKFTKDYISAFKEAGIVTQETISHFVSEKSDLKETIACLFKLQSAAELLVLFKSFVEPPQIMLFDFMRKALRILEKSNSPKGPHVFKFDLERLVFQQLIQAHEADGDKKRVWQMCLYSEQGTYSVRTRYSICRMIPSGIDWLVDDNTNDDMQTSVPGRYSIVNTEIKDDVFGV